MSLNLNKKKNKYHELDNYEDQNFIESKYERKKAKKIADIKSAENIPKCILLNISNENNSTNTDSQKGGRKANSLEKKRTVNKVKSFSPDNFTNSKERPTEGKASNDDCIFLENIIMDVMEQIEQKNYQKKEIFQQLEKVLANFISRKKKISSKETREKLQNIIKVVCEQEVQNQNQTLINLQKIISNVLDMELKSPDILIQTDSIIENEQPFQEDALRESFHEVALKNLIKNSFVEKSKHRLPFSVIVQTNSIKTAIENGMKQIEENENCWELVKNNLFSIICAIIITIVLCIMLIL